MSVQEDTIFSQQNHKLSLNPFTLNLVKDKRLSYHVFSPIANLI
jgi:hypothetical protein